MKAKSLVFLLTSTGLIFSACQKEADESPNNIQNEGKVLWKYVEMDTTLTPGLDTVDVYFFEYDIQKRIVRRTNYYRDDTSSSPAYPFNSITDFFYNGNERHPYKTIRRTQEDRFTEFDTSYYAYQNNLLITDSSRILVSIPLFPYRMLTVRHFSNSVNSTQMDEHLSQYSDPNPPPPVPSCISTYTITKTHSNGNISSEDANATGCTTGGWDAQYVYDNKINPFHELEIPYPVMLFSNFNSQKNNLTEVITSSNLHWRYTYTYRADGYPLVMRASGVFDPSTTWKGIYFYKD